jgi:hypothetical protein
MSLRVAPNAKPHFPDVRDTGLLLVGVSVSSANLTNCVDDLAAGPACVVNKLQGFLWAGRSKTSLMKDVGDWVTSIATASAMSSG